MRQRNARWRRVAASRTHDCPALSLYFFFSLIVLHNLLSIFLHSTFYIGWQVVAINWRRALCLNGSYLRSLTAMLQHVDQQALSRTRAFPAFHNWTVMQSRHLLLVQLLLQRLLHLITLVALRKDSSCTQCWFKSFRWQSACLTVLCILRTWKIDSMSNECMQSTLDCILTPLKPRLCFLSCCKCSLTELDDYKH